MYVCMYVCTYVRMYICMDRKLLIMLSCKAEPLSSLHIGMHVRMYVRMHVRTYVCIYVWKEARDDALMRTTLVIAHRYACIHRKLLIMLSCKAESLSSLHVGMHVRTYMHVGMHVCIERS